MDLIKKLKPNIFVLKICFFGNRLSHIFKLFILVIGLFTGQILHADITMDQAEMIRQKVAQLQAIRRQQIDMNMALDAQEKKEQQKIQQLSGQRKRLKDEVAQEQQAVNEQLVDIAQANHKIRQAMTWQQLIVSHGSMLLDDLVVPPVEIDEQASIDLLAIKKIFDKESKFQISDDASEIPTFKAVSQLSSWFSTLRQQSRKIELFNQPITLTDGRQLNAYVLQLGLVGSLFELENKKLSGYLQDGSWQINLSEPQRKAIHQAIAILRGQQPPSLVDLPLTLPVEGQ